MTRAASGRTRVISGPDIGGGGRRRAGNERTNAQNVAKLTRPQRERFDQQHHRTEKPRLRGRTANIEVHHVVHRVYA
jgi:hypothetical protein